jgi:hypothetical protein
VLILEIVLKRLLKIKKLNKIRAEGGGLVKKGKESLHIKANK